MLEMSHAKTQWGKDRKTPLYLSAKSMTNRSDSSMTVKPEEITIRVLQERSHYSKSIISSDQILQKYTFSRKEEIKMFEFSVLNN